MPPMSNLINPTEIISQYGNDISSLSPMEIPKEILDELLLIFSVIGSTSTTTSTNESTDRAHEHSKNVKRDHSNKTIIPVTDCLNWLQDLQRALRRDDDTYRSISLLLAHWKVVERTLIPLAIRCKYDTAIIMTITKIMVLLTKPMNERAIRAARLVLDPKKIEPKVMEEQVKLRENGIQQSEMLIQYKKMIVQHDSGVKGTTPSNQNYRHSGKNKGETTFLSIIVSLLSEPLSRTGSARTDSDHLTIELVLHLFRNLLSADPLFRVSAEDSEKANILHRQLVTLFDEEHVLELILVLSQDMEARENAQYNLLIMEILHALVRDQDPVGIALHSTFKSSQDHGKFSKKLVKSSTSLLSLLREEKRKTVALPNRHSHFGGMIAIQSSTGKKRIVSTNRVFSTQNKTLEINTQKRRGIRQSTFIGSKSNANDQIQTMMSQNNCGSRLHVKFQNVLQKFSYEFLSKAYGPLTKSLKNEFRRESSRLEESDKLLYFRIVSFFSAFGRTIRKSRQRQQRHHLHASKVNATDNSAIGSLVFTMDIFSFSLLLKSIVTYNDQKKYLKLAQAVSLYKEMMYLLYEMTDSKDDTEKDMALGLMDRLFYSNEPSDLSLKLFSWWKPGIGTRDYLADLVELQHVSLKLLDSYANNYAVDDEKSKRKKRKLTESENENDIVSRIRKDAESFDVNVYFGKLVSNHTVQMFTLILAQYISNSPEVNHHITAFFIRLSKFVIFAPIEGEGYDCSELKLKKTTLEPMLYNINLLLVFSKILNDGAIREREEFKQILQLSATILRHFCAAAQGNPMLYVEALFRFSQPHRVCEMIKNQYVTEELLMITEREILLERAREDDENWGEVKLISSEMEKVSDNVSNKDDDSTIGDTSKKMPSVIATPQDQMESNTSTNPETKIFLENTAQNIQGFSNAASTSKIQSRPKQQRRIKKISLTHSAYSDDEDEVFDMTDTNDANNVHVDSSQLVFDDDE